MSSRTDGAGTGGTTPAAALDDEDELEELDEDEEEPKPSGILDGVAFYVGLILMLCDYTFPVPIF